MKTFIDSHCHTISSGHAYSTVSENAQAAALKGLTHMAITDHAPAMPGTCGLFHFMNLTVIPKILHGVNILTGVELSILGTDGAVDLPQYVLETLDVVIASLHSPCLAPTTKKDHTEALVNVMKNPAVNIIGHLDNPVYEFEVDTIINAAIANNVYLELNNSSLAPESLRRGDVQLMKEIINKCKQKKHPIIFGSDAHFFDKVGEFSHVKKLAVECKMPNSLILNTSFPLFKERILDKVKR